MVTIENDDLTIFVRIIEKINKIMKKVSNYRTAYSKVYFINNGYIYMKEKEQMPQYVDIFLDENALVTKTGKLNKQGNELKRFKEIISDLRFNISSNLLSTYISQNKKTSINKITIDNELVMINDFHLISEKDLEFEKEFNIGEYPLIFSSSIDIDELNNYEKQKTPFKCYITPEKLLIEQKPTEDEFLYFRYFYNGFIFPSDKKSTKGIIDIYETSEDLIYDIVINLKDEKGFLVRSLLRVLDVMC